MTPALRQVLFGGRPTAVVIPTTWNALDKATNIGLDASRLIATHSTNAVWESGRSTGYLPPGVKAYFTVTLNAADGGVGFANTSMVLGNTGSNHLVGNNDAADSIGVNSQDGRIYANNGTSQGILGGGTTFPNGTIIQVAINRAVTPNKVWWKLSTDTFWNGTGTDGPAISGGADVGGINLTQAGNLTVGVNVYAAYSVDTTTGSITANFSPASPPAGYSTYSSVALGAF